ncbi:MAG TPA: hypothetical protein DCP28_21090 [Cytophagales bacterium]|nr:hypothetical protein [Cytophagales bacterium]
MVSGYSLDQDQGKVDRTYSFNELDNMMSLLNARETRQSTLIRLLAYLLAHPQQRAALSPEAQASLDQAYGQGFPQGEVESLEETLKQRYATETKAGGSLYDLINSKDKYFSLKQLGNLKAERIGTSDMLKVRYSNLDAWLCQKTLELFTEVFMEKHQVLKHQDSNQAISFFEQQVRASQAALAEAEAQLEAFGTDNKIINYYEQTRYIAEQKEDLDKLFFEERMDFEAAKASLTELETKLETKYNIAVTSGQMLDLRDRLSDISNKIALLELNRAGPQEDARMARYQTQALTIQDSIAEKTQTLFTLSRTVEGVSADQILKEWLHNTIIYYQSEARISAIRQRQQDFENIYARFAPLGSKLKKIEREIGVREEEYLSNLHSLNVAKLHQYNLQMSTNLKVVDPPFLPLEAAPSKRMQMTILGCMLGFIFPFGVLVALALFDPTLKSPGQLAKLSGYSVLGAFPALNSRMKSINEVRDRVLSGFTQTLLGWQQKKATASPLRIHLTSLVPKVGKSTLQEAWLQDLGQRGITVSEELAAAEVILFETPALNSPEFPAQDLLPADHHVVVISAKTIWDEAAHNTLKRLEALHPAPIHLVLNGCPMEGLEEYIGEIPKQRTWLRRTFKKYLSRS